MYISIKSTGHSSKFVARNIECNVKNSMPMLKILDQTDTSISLTDLAINKIEVNKVVR